MNLNNYAENLKRNIIINLLTDVKRKMMEDTVFVMKAKLHTLNALHKLNRFKIIF